MGVHVGQMSTDMKAEPEPPSGGAAPAQAPRWDELARLREQMARLEHDRRRTRAEGFDD
jgi:hypothetical protein